MKERWLGRAALALGLVLALAVGYVVGQDAGPPPARAGGETAALLKPPDSVKRKLQAMNRLLALLRERVANGELAPDSEAVQTLLLQIEGLKRDVIEDFEKTWPGVSGWIRDLVSIDDWLARAETAFVHGDKDRLLLWLEVAEKSKQAMESALQVAGTFRPFRVALAVSSDHDPPQSDACVAISTKPARPGAAVWATLEGQGEGAVAGALAQRLTLDARGRAGARFLVTKIGVFRFDVLVISKRGHSLLASRAFSNATPSAQPCRA